jgi:activator of 2-hydroxyglutaryl-CoA dehydratase
MRTLQAQRHKKQTEYESKHRREMLEQIWEEADAEAKKLEGLMTGYRENNLKEAFKQVFEVYREDDEAVYFEEGFIEW